ncbi:hypothetical protein THOM_2473 [Trachipleistophora hominis]|uniref:Uncharacterized protein n=1 Tax=Trachipleistophora hominis TaxID=72359 RepID=L7JTA5_TRAHO|nr:hypothetical protein THOM_2473 [Trachipleistophora hominis]
MVNAGLMVDWCCNYVFGLKWLGAEIVQYRILEVELGGNEECGRRLRMNG